MEILDPETKSLHHYSLRLDTIDRTKAKGWFSKPEASFRLEGDENNEIAAFFKFLKAILEGQLSDLRGEVHLIGNEQYNQLQRFLEELPKLPSVDRLEIVKVLLSQLDESSGEIGEYISVFKNGIKIIFNIQMILYLFDIFCRSRIIIFYVYCKQIGQVFLYDNIAIQIQYFILIGN